MHLDDVSLLEVVDDAAHPRPEALRQLLLPELGGHRVEGLEALRLALDETDDVDACGGAERVGELTGLERGDCVPDLGAEVGDGDRAEVPAGGGVARDLLLEDGGELAAAADGGDELLRAGERALGITLLGSDGENQVLEVHLLRDAEPRLLPGVALAELLLGDGHVADLALHDAVDQDLLADAGPQLVDAEPHAAQGLLEVLVRLDPILLPQPLELLSDLLVRDLDLELRGALEKAEIVGCFLDQSGVRLGRDRCAGLRRPLVHAFAHVRDGQDRVVDTNDDALDELEVARDSDRRGDGRGGDER